jgi:beta-mannosidase
VKRIELRDGWRLARSEPGAAAGPADLAGLPLAWRDAVVPGTVAQSLGLDPSGSHDLDSHDWWYRCTFAAPTPRAARHWLRLDGLATLAQVWLNGEPLLDSRNMFLGHRIEVTAHLRDVNHLAIRFASLKAALEAKRPRPRWKTALVESQNLRWFRTTLLGRMPGWTPQVAAIGPFGAVALESADVVELVSLDLQPSAREGRGRIHLRAAIARLDGRPLEEARLRIGDQIFALPILHGHDARIHADLDVGEVPLWWPHTHGEPRRLPCALEVRANDRWIAIDCGPIGFREIAIDTAGGKVQLAVNGVPVFCRGACWTTQDFLGVHATREVLRRALTLARDAGANMLRVGGTMAYESADFYSLCDELGILVWQDFMFANMDYPVADPVFRASIEAEARHQLGRLQRHACIAAYCGGSEIAQQAAMMGLPAETWANEFFAEALPGLCATWHAGVPYFPSTPWGGALPFHVGTGIAHYYGVGAYRRPLADVKSARVKFAAECLAFANVPEAATMAAMADGATLPPHHPRWKARVPRDNGAGWDFEDIRDHYLRELFGVDPVDLRSRDLERYYALSREVPGEVMRRVFAHWRSPYSGCAGALVWVFQDLLAGAGWGIVDGLGRPKACYWHLKRAWAPRTLHLTDEGLDGVAVHVVNDHAEALEATLELSLVTASRRATASARQAVHVPARGAVSFSGDALFGHFTDSTNSYRFGPPKHDVVHARLTAADGIVLGEDFLFPAGMALAPAPEPRAAVRVAERQGNVVLHLSSDTFLQGVHVECEGFTPDDDHFHVAPGCEKTIVFTRHAQVPFRARFEAINAEISLEARHEPSGLAADGDTARGQLT